MSDVSPDANKGAFRATDDDRDRTVAVLNNSLVIGQLTPDEHEQRIQRALQATTIGDLDDLISDLKPSQSSPWLSRHWRPVIAAVIAVSAVGTTVSLLATAGNGSPPLVPSTITQTTGDGFVGPQPDVAGRFCLAMAANQKQNPRADPSGITPLSDPWGGRVQISPSATAATQEDLAAVRSVSLATQVVQIAWQANGNQYKGLSISCLGDYSPTFQWADGGTSSTKSTMVSAAFENRHSLIAVRSTTGTCWYELNVMYRGDPIIQSDGLSSYGVFSAMSQGSDCSADGAPGYGLWQSENPLPPQLSSS